MNLSYLVACGLMVTLLSVRMGAKPLSQAQQKSLRSLLGEELADFMESEERERRLDAVRSRILRDLRTDTRARGMWARLLNDQPAPRRHKSGNKKGGSTSRSGCFGHKMDRIGTISGMGC
ncbi:C-type natriuretic peptide [Limanda limanda]|uniref:C-type natriuretic peptide n=1 Tax=Limanda limanda TaxID=27771 RepID=UPI0029C94D53|nr:C-type natriuretic peptide [Limanda limanda]